jgi:formamidopyrimidine-DNA glycosylase
MPEGPEAHHCSKILNEQLAGKILEQVVIHKVKSSSSSSSSSDKLVILKVKNLEKLKLPLKIKSIYAVGKRCIISSTNNGPCLVFSFGMTGQFRFEKINHTRATFVFSSEKETDQKEEKTTEEKTNEKTVSAATEKETTAGAAEKINVYYDDVRNFSQMVVFKNEVSFERWRKINLGWDPLSHLVGCAGDDAKEKEKLINMVEEKIVSAAEKKKVAASATEEKEKPAGAEEKKTAGAAEEEKKMAGAATYKMVYGTSFRKFKSIFMDAGNNCKVAATLGDTTQSKICGIGNYLRAEILYRAGISPLRKSNSLSDEELILLLRMIKKVMYASYIRGGHTLKSFCDPVGNKGKFKPRVYLSKFNPRDEDANVTRDIFEYPVKRVKIGSQNVYWCPYLQR